MAVHSHYRPCSLNTIELTTMAEEAEQLALSVFPDGRHIVTGSADRMLRLWDLKDRTVLKKIEGHRGRVRAVAVASQDRQLIASALPSKPTPHTSVHWTSHRTV